MLSCLACRATLESLYKVRLSPRFSNAYRIGFTTSSVSRNSTSPSDFLSPRQEALTLVHKVSKFIPVAFSLQSDSESTRSVQRWDYILSRIRQDLGTENPRPIKILVCPLDEWSGSQNLVLALLTDPFSDENYNHNLIDRWKPCDQDQFRITYDPHSKLTDPAYLALPPPYLTQFSVPIELIELRRPPTQHENPLSISQMLDNSPIAEADIPILVCNPFVTSLSTISACRIPSNSILVLSAGIPRHELDEILKPLQSARCEPLQIVSVEPRRAANAIQILQRDPNSLVAIQRYQDNIIGSQISQITVALRSKLSRPTHSMVQTELAVHRISDVLDACQGHLRSTKYDLDTAFLDAGTLRDRIEEYIARAQSDVFEKRGVCGKQRNRVLTAVEQAQKDLIQTMDRLTWWRLLWKVDEITTTVATAVQAAWCHDLEKELILKTGKLSALQRETSSSAFELLSKYPIIQTAVLQNQIMQLEASPSYQLSPESLTKPIHARRDQIIKYPTARLHIAGQKIILRMGGGVATGVGAGWVGWLLGSSEGMFSFLGMEPSTAIGAGMLVAVAGLRWSIGSWEKAKKRWWQDWRRVGEGLKRDLENTLDRTMCQQVTVVAKTASDGVFELVNKREQEIAAARRQLDELQSSLKCVTAKLSPNKTS